MSDHLLSVERGSIGILGIHEQGVHAHAETEYARRVIVRDGDKGLRDTTSLVLRRRLAQPKVKLAASAFEPASIVVPT